MAPAPRVRYRSVCGAMTWEFDKTKVHESMMHAFYRTTKRGDSRDVRLSSAGSRSL